MNTRRVKTTALPLDVSHSFGITSSVQVSRLAEEAQIS